MLLYQFDVAKYLKETKVIFDNTDNRLLFYKNNLTNFDESKFNREYPDCKNDGLTNVDEYFGDEIIIDDNGSRKCSINQSILDISSQNSLTSMITKKKAKVISIMKIENNSKNTIEKGQSEKSGSICEQRQRERIESGGLNSWGKIFLIRDFMYLPALFVFYFE